jgi:transcriptional regulator with XRE-family HTH domain
MNTETLKQVLRQNVLKFLSEDGPLRPRESGVQRLVKLGIPNGTAQRVLGAEASVGLDVLEQIAKALGVAPWRLLRPLAEPVAQRSGTDADPQAARIGLQIQGLPVSARQALQTIISALEANLTKKDAAKSLASDA